MIVNRYIQRNIYLGTLGALLLLISIGLFIAFVNELDDMGEGSYGIRRHCAQYKGQRQCERIKYDTAGDANK